MKTKELISQLQENDPTGELEVSVGNIDIHFVSVEPAYYDGCQEVLVRDDKEECYNIIGAKVVSNGDKVVIHTLGINDAIFEDPKLKVEYDAAYSKKYKMRHDAWRKFANNVDRELRLKSFIEFVKRRIPAAPQEKIVKAATDFYGRNLIVGKNEESLPTYEVKKEGGTCIPSWYDREQTYWNETIAVYYMEDEVVIQKLDE